MKEISIIQKTKGITDSIPEERIEYNFDEGFANLSALINCDILDSFRLSKRTGYKATSYTSSAHSLYVYQGIGYCIYDGYICLIKWPCSVQQLSQTALGQPVYWQGIGSRVFFSDGLTGGYIDNGTVYPWSIHTYVGPLCTKDYSLLPKGTHLTVHKGRLYAVTDNNVLWYSYPFNFLATNRSTNYILYQDTIRVVKSVGNVLFVGTSAGVNLLKGDSPESFTLDTVLHTPVIENSEVLTRSPNVMGQQLQDAVLFFMTTAGLYLCTEEGEIKLITSAISHLPWQLLKQKGTAYIKDNFYTVLLR